MRIIFLSPAAQMGGAEAVLLELLRALREARPDWPLHVIAGEEGPLLEKIRALDVTCELLAFPKLVRVFGENRHRARKASWTGRGQAKMLRLMTSVRVAAAAALYICRLRRRLRQLKPDVLHSNGMKMHLLGALAKPGGVPLVWHLHDYLSARPTMLPLLRCLSKRCQIVIANSESVAFDVRRVLPAEPSVHAVHNAIDPEVFTPEGLAMDLDQAAGLPPATPGTVRVGLIATFALWKGHKFFLQAVASLADAKLPAPLRFYIIGGPVYATVGSQYTLEELRTRSVELGICERVGFTGFVADVPAAIRALDIVVHASTEPEPFGLVIVQAMACARAVIVSAAGGACELVDAEVDALTYPPGNADALAGVLMRLASSHNLRVQLGTTGREKVLRRFTRYTLAKRIVALYEDRDAFL